MNIGVGLPTTDPPALLDWARRADAAYRRWRTTEEGASDLGTVLAAAPTLTLFTIAEGV